jgi:hypothetical protein
VAAFHALSDTNIVNTNQSSNQATTVIPVSISPAGVDSEKLHVCPVFPATSVCSSNNRVSSNRIRCVPGLGREIEVTV